MSTPHTSALIGLFNPIIEPTSLSALQAAFVGTNIVWANARDGRNPLRTDRVTTIMDPILSQIESARRNIAPQSALAGSSVPIGVICAWTDQTGLPDQCVDTYIVDHFQNEPYSDLVWDEAERIIRPGGRLIAIRHLPPILGDHFLDDLSQQAAREWAGWDDVDLARSCAGSSSKLKRSRIDWNTPMIARCNCGLTPLLNGLWKLHRTDEQDELYDEEFFDIGVEEYFNNMSMQWGTPESRARSMTVDLDILVFDLDTGER